MSGLAALFKVNLKSLHSRTFPSCFITGTTGAAKLEYLTGSITPVACNQSSSNETGLALLNFGATVESTCNVATKSFAVASSSLNTAKWLSRPPILVHDLQNSNQCSKSIG